MSIAATVASPYMLRLHVDNNTGAAEKLTLTALLALCAEGPLKKFLATKTATWGTQYAAPASVTGHPLADARLSVIPMSAPRAAGQYAGVLGVSMYSDTGTNTLAVSGGTNGELATDLAYNTFGEVEIRLNHSGRR
jgi:hypothetical protein